MSQHQRDYILYYIRDMRTLAERLIWAREQKGLSQEALAKLSGVSQSTIGNLEAGIRQTARKIVEIAAAAGVDPMWLANGTGEPKQSAGIGSEYRVEEPASVYAAEGAADSPFLQPSPGVRIGDEPDTIPIRRVQVKVRAGITGFETIPEMEDGGVLHVPRKVIENLNLTPHYLLATQSKGCSMEPMIFDGDWVVVNTIDKIPVNGKVYEVNFDGEACIKQLVHEGGQWYLHSLNPDFKRVNVRSGQCEIIGRVVFQPGRVI